MRLRNKPGFSMMEAILAVVVLVLSLSPIIMVQTSRIRASSANARLFDRMEQAALFLHSMLFNAQDSKDEKSREKTLRKPATKLLFTQDKPSERSSLHVFRSITLARVTLQWRDGVTDLTDALVTCYYKPPQEQP